MDVTTKAIRTIICRFYYPDHASLKAPSLLLILVQLIDSIAEFECDINLVLLQYISYNIFDIVPIDWYSECIKETLAL
jgi:hypothetical protein